MTACMESMIFILIVILSYYLLTLYFVTDIPLVIIGGTTSLIQEVFDVYTDKILNEFANIISIKSKVIETIDDIEHTMDYKSARQNGLGLLPQHIGQRKLLLSEVQFLTKVGKVKYCIYAGSAPKHTMLYLSQLFPHIKFILVDPNKFSIVIPNHSTHRFTKHKDIVHLKSGYPEACNTLHGKDYVDTIESTNYKIYIIEDYMTSKLSHELKRLKGDICFVSDIRSKIIDTNQSPSDFDVLWNNCMMYNWMNILKPVRSMVKYRPLYDTNNIEVSNSANIMEDFTEAKTYGLDFLGNIKKNIVIYSKSKVYVQAWAGRTSSEVRLWIDRKDINNLVVYNNTEMEQKMFYFNFVDRNWVYHTNKNANKKLHFCNCNDCSLENKIWENYGYKGKQILDAVVHLGEITHRKLSNVHKFDYYSIFNKKDTMKRLVLYRKIMDALPPRSDKSRYGHQKGNLGKN